MLTKVWDRYPEVRRKEYEDFIKMYGSLSALFNQKSDKSGIPYLDSKFQETIFARSFNDKNDHLMSKDVDYGNTPHDILSVFPDGTRIGIGIKTWLYSHKSYQKVAQIKSYNSSVDKYLNNYLGQTDPTLKSDAKQDLVQYISGIKNESLERDYRRLGLNPHLNIYNYVTRDKGKLNIQETSYPEIDINHIHNIKFKRGRKNKNGKRGIASVYFNDGLKQYHYAFADSQFFMHFNATPSDHKTVQVVHVNIMQDPFGFLKDAFNSVRSKPIILPAKKNKPVYLPMYSYRGRGRDKTKVIHSKSGLNASLGAPKTKGSDRRRPEYEVYIPVPKKFRQLNRHWFSPNVDLTNRPAYKQKYRVGSFKFTLHLPDGTTCPALIGQDNFKGFESDPQDVLGKWLLWHIFRKKPYEQITMTDLDLAGYDSLKLWHEIPNDPHDIWIDFAPLGSYERFIKNENNNY